MKKELGAFTLVELIVVITILAILGTIAFISLQGYSKEARDSKRITDARNLIGKITIGNTKGTQLSSLINANTTINLKIDGTGAISNIGVANFENLKEQESNFKDPLRTEEDYPVAYSVGGISSGAYNFAQIATISEQNNQARLFGNYYEMQPGDAPSLFNKCGEPIEDGKGNLPYPVGDALDSCSWNDGSEEEEGGEGEGDGLDCIPGDTRPACNYSGVAWTFTSYSKDGCNNPSINNEGGVMMDIQVSNGVDVYTVAPCNVGTGITGIGNSSYGGYYSWSQIQDPDFCGTGYHVPTKEEWKGLIKVGHELSAWGVGFSINSSTGKISWNSSEKNKLVNKLSLPVAGAQNGTINQDFGVYWAIDSANTSNGYRITIGDNSVMPEDTLGKTILLPVRCFKDFDS